MTGEVGEDIQWRTAKRRAALALSILKRETPVAETTREHASKVADVEE